MSLDEAIASVLQSPEMPYGAIRRAAVTALLPFGVGALPAITAKLAELDPRSNDESVESDARYRAKYAAEALRLAAVRIAAVASTPLSEEHRAVLANELDSHNDKDLDVLEGTIALLDGETRASLFAGDLRPKDHRSILRLAYLVPSTLQRVVDATAQIDLGKWDDHYLTTHAAAIHAFGPSAVPVVLAAIPNAKNDGAVALARGVEKVVSAEHATALVDLLGHAAKGVRLSATTSLQRLGAEAKTALEKGTSSKKKAIREACAELMSALGAERSRADELLANAPSIREAVVARMVDARTKDYPLYDGIPKELAKTHGALALAAAHDWIRDKVNDSSARGVYNAVLEALKDDADAAWIAVKMFASLPKVSPYTYREFTYRFRAMGTLTEAPLVSVLKGPTFPLRVAAFELLTEVSKKVDRDVLVAGLADASKEIRVKCTELLPAHHDKDVASLVVPLLSEKASEVRLAAAQVLFALKASEHHDALASALEREKKPDVAAAIEKALAACVGGAPGEAKRSSATSTPSVATSTEDTESSVVLLLAKERKAKLPKWLDLSALPELLLASGQVLDGDALLGFVTRLMNEGPDMEDPLARRVRKHLDDVSACTFSIAVKDAWRSDSKHKWAIYQQAIMVDEERLNALGPRLDELTSGGQHHFAGWCVDVLARHGAASPCATNVGLSWVAYWAKASETTSLRKKAVAALEAAATVRGKKVTELEPELNAYVADDVADTQIPTLDMESVGTLDFGVRKLTLHVSPDLELLVRNEEGELLDKLPSPTKKDDANKAKAAKDEYARLKRALGAVFREQKMRLEQAMVSGRPLSRAAFQKLFVAHPLMRRLGESFVFSSRRTTFRPADGELVDASYAPVTLEEDAVIRLAHRHELDDETVNAWAEHLADEKRIQPFEQIGRAVHPRQPTVPPPARKLAPATLAGRLHGSGWRHSRVEDAGMCYEAYRAFPGRKVRAHVSHGGVHVSDPAWSSDPVGIDNVWFTDLSGDTIDPAIVDAIVFSEVVRDLEHIVDA